MFAGMYVCEPRACLVPEEVENLHVDARNQTQVLSKNKKYS